MWNLGLFEKEMVKRCQTMIMAHGIPYESNQYSNGDKVFVFQRTKP